MCAGFVPGDYFRLLFCLVIKEQAKEKDLVIRAWLRNADPKNALGRGSAFCRFSRQEGQRLNPGGSVLYF